MTDKIYGAVMLLLLILIGQLGYGHGDVINVTWGKVKSHHDLQHLPHFWTSTGFSPLGPALETLLSDDEHMNIMLLGSLPKGSLTHVRVHWLLDLVMAFRDGENLQFDFSKLDIFLDWLHEVRLKPGFEIMGNPSGVFNNLNNLQQQRWWRHMVKAIVQRYIAKYGLVNVKQWRFETWNEPDLHLYNTLNFNLHSFEAYFQASIEGLRSGSDGEVRLGGPAGLFRTPSIPHPLCWGLLDKIQAENRSEDLEFISFHRKGNATSKLILEGAMELVHQFQLRYPQLQHLPISNDEADPLTGWWRPEEWRADVRYAAMVSKGVVQHLEAMVRQNRFPLKFLSNDNAFLSTAPNFFTQRTLLARFQMNESSDAHTQFILKPVYVTLGLLSLLGDREMPLNISASDSRVSFLCGGTWHKDHSFSAGLLLVVNDETREDVEQKLHFNLTLPLKDWTTGIDARYSVFLLDNKRSNPSVTWQKGGSPMYPNPQLRKAMREVQNAHRLVTSKPAPEFISLHLRVPSVALVQLCTRPLRSLGQVTRLRGFRVTRGEVLLIWSDKLINTRCLLRYEVEWRPSNNSNFQRINLDQNNILLSFHFAYESGFPVEGDFRVRAVDLWLQPGLFSSTYHL